MPQIRLVGKPKRMAGTTTVLPAAAGVPTE
jgi:hypothetical protein